MNNLNWDDSFTVGIDEIDHQHKLLLDYFSLLLDAIAMGGRWSDVHFPLVQLREYAYSHFGKEESLMRMSDYPGTEEHCESHRKIIQGLDALEKDSLHKNITEEATAFLQNWLIGHIMHADKDYARHFANGGKIIVRDVFTN